VPVFLLEPRRGRPDEGTEGLDPWEPWYDKAFAIVVVAADENAARLLARTDFPPGGSDPAQSTCERIDPDGEPCIVCVDVREA
jgi:hypothetical protein